MRIFEGQEIYQFAMRIEENGERFYRQAAQGVQEKDARGLFEHLADEEVKHRKIFEGMLPKQRPTRWMRDTRENTSNICGITWMTKWSSTREKRIEN